MTTIELSENDVNEIIKRINHLLQGVNYGSEELLKNIFEKSKGGYLNHICCLHLNPCTQIGTICNKSISEFVSEIPHNPIDDLYAHVERFDPMIIISFKYIIRMDGLFITSANKILESVGMENISIDDSMSSISCSLFEYKIQSVTLRTYYFATIPLSESYSKDDTIRKVRTSGFLESIISLPPGELELKCVNMLRISFPFNKNCEF